MKRTIRPFRLEEVKSLKENERVEIEEFDTTKVIILSTDDDLTHNGVKYPIKCEIIKRFVTEANYTEDGVPFSPINEKLVIAKYEEE